MSNGQESVADTLRRSRSLHNLDEAENVSKIQYNVMRERGARSRNERQIHSGLDAEDITLKDELATCLQGHSRFRHFSSVEVLVFVRRHRRVEVRNQ